MGRESQGFERTVVSSTDLNRTGLSSVLGNLTILKTDHFEMRFLMEMKDFRARCSNTNNIP